MILCLSRCGIHISIYSKVMQGQVQGKINRLTLKIGGKETKYCIQFVCFICQDNFYIYIYTHTHC